MEGSDLQRAVRAGQSAASALGLRVEDAALLHNSNRIALRLTPCEVLAKIAPPGPAWQAGAEFEVEIARQLAAVGSPIAELEPRVGPRVVVRDGFVVTLWTYYEPAPPPEITPGEYGRSLVRLHAGLRQTDIEAPRFTDRVAEARSLVTERAQTPELPGPDRELLIDTLSHLGDSVRRWPAPEQLLHGEPHPGNLLRTGRGLLFIDLETCCYGPVEFDVAHGLLPAGSRAMAVADVCGAYPAADRLLVEQCHTLIWAMITAWRWDRDDQLPDRDYWRGEGLSRLRAALDRSDVQANDNTNCPSGNSAGKSGEAGAGQDPSG